MPRQTAVNCLILPTHQEQLVSAAQHASLCASEHLLWLQVGYDQHSFGYRDLEGVKVSRALSV